MRLKCTGSLKCCRVGTEEIERGFSCRVTAVPLISNSSNLLPVALFLVQLLLSLLTSRHLRQSLQRWLTRGQCRRKKLLLNEDRVIAIGAEGKCRETSLSLHVSFAQLSWGVALLDAQLRFPNNRFQLFSFFFFF